MIVPTHHCFDNISLARKSAWLTFSQWMSSWYFKAQDERGLMESVRIKPVTHQWPCFPPFKECWSIVKENDADRRENQRQKKGRETDRHSPSNRRVTRPDCIPDSLVWFSDPSLPSVSQWNQPISFQVRLVWVELLYLMTKLTCRIWLQCSCFLHFHPFLTREGFNELFLSSLTSLVPSLSVEPSPRAWQMPPSSCKVFSLILWALLIQLWLKHA